MTRVCLMDFFFPFRALELVQRNTRLTSRGPHADECRYRLALPIDVLSVSDFYHGDGAFFILHCIHDAIPPLP